MRMITVASGKGGVGKSTLVANLGVALAQCGDRVVLFDADLGLANLDVIMNLRSTRTIEQAVDGVTSISDLMVQGPAGIRVVAGGSGIGKLLRLSRKRLETFLLQSIPQIENETDFVIFDTSSGADSKVMTFLRLADEVILVTTPDPASAVDAYATAKVLFRSRPEAFVRILVNMVQDEAQAYKVFTALHSAIDRFVHKSVFYAGYVRSDPRAGQLVRKSQLYVEVAPNMPTSRDAKSIAAMLHSHPSSYENEPAADRMRTAFLPARRKAA
jgi:flagellar biosynthesis protein FlhG